MYDVHDILDAGRPQIEEAPAAPISKRGPKPKPPKPQPIIRRKPEGMHRELFALLNTSDSDAPLLPSDYAPISDNSYKQNRANLGIKKPRKWDVVEFTNSARKDDLILKHWQRVDAAPSDYPFAKYNSRIDSHIPKYNDSEYNTFLLCDQWTKEETDYLMQMCSRFDLRFIVIHDRWDKNRFKTERTVEDLKERYYFVHNQLEKARANTANPPKLKEYDSIHERKRKEQLLKLYNRTKEQIEEEQNLLNELKKIEQKKKERERKMLDLQKIMDAGNRSSSDHHHKRNDSTPASVGRPCGSGMRGMPGRRPGRGAGRPSRDSITSVSSTSQVLGTASSLLDLSTISIKFQDFKTSGASLRSQRLKLPTSLGGKKAKALENMLSHLELDQYPMPTESICQGFNELRGDLMLLYELKMGIEGTKFEINTINNQLKTIKPELVAPDPLADQSSISSQDTSSRDISDVIDINAANTPGRKRKAALEQSNVLRKLKKTL